MTRDGRLYVWPGRGRGARVLSSGLPSGRTRLLHLTGAHILLVRERRCATSITRIDRETGNVATVYRSLDADLIDVRCQSGRDAVLFVSKGAVEAIDPRTGKTLACRETTGEYARGFYLADHIRRLIWNGVTFELAPFPTIVDPRDIIEVFGWAGHPGPLVVERHHGVRAATGELLLEADVSSVSGISEDGSRITARAADGSFLLLDLPRGKAVRAEDYPMTWLELGQGDVPTRSIRSRIVEVAAARSGRFIVGTAKGQCFELTARPDGTLGLRSCPRDADFRALRKKPTPPRYGCELSVASWGSGNRVFLDSRGMLHLKPADRSLEEVTLILAESTATAWSSSGGVCGAPFFLDGPSTVDAKAILEKIRRMWEPSR